MTAAVAEVGSPMVSSGTSTPAAAALLAASGPATPSMAPWLHGGVAGAGEQVSEGLAEREQRDHDDDDVDAVEQRGDSEDQAGLPGLGVDADQPDGDAD